MIVRKTTSFALYAKCEETIVPIHSPLRADVP